MKKEKKVLKFIKNCKCPICGEKFVIPKSMSGWVYKYYAKGKIHYVCSWKCLNKYRESEESKKETRGGWNRGRKKIG
jgi:YHS domain-containing protein